MRKKSNMDNYEKKYKKALNRAIIAHKDEDRHLKATLERIFPELKESKSFLNTLETKEVDLETKLNYKLY